MLNRYSPPWVFLSYLAIGVVALALRVADLGVFVMGDEWGFWMRRSATFLEALQTGDFGATAVSLHPGVTTMWLGSAGILLHRLLLAWGVVEDTFPVRLALMQLPVALTHGAGVVVGYGLLRRILPFPPLTAFLAALLWATDPFIIGFDRLLHVDGLNGTFAMLSLLAACGYWNHTPRHAGWLVFSAVCGALAMMSKSTGVAVVPVVGVLALASDWPRSVRTSPLDETRRPSRSLWSWSRSWSWSWLLPLLAWGAIFALTMVVVWPAVWAAPMKVYDLLWVGVEVEAAAPHSKGNFFLGQDDPTPGPLFYPVALALRTTPWSLVGLLLLPLALWGQRAGGERRGAELRNLAVLAGFCILFVAGVTLFPKKLNRYLAPIFPAVDTLAAFGLLWGIAHLAPGPRWKEWKATGVRYARYALVGLLGVAALVNAVWWHPYGMAYFNQALGGHRAGADTFLVGMGEGLEQVAAWLNQQPDSTGVVTLSSTVYSLRPYLKEGVYASPARGETLPDRTGYVVIYVRNVWGEALPPFDQFYQRVPPVHVVTIHGVDYAWIYQVPQEMPHDLTVDFGEAIRLQGYDIGASAVRTTGYLTVTTQWQARVPVPEDYRLFVHVLDEDGKLVGHADVPPAGPDAPTSTWQPHRYYRWMHPVLLPSDLPAGPYWVTLGLYRPDDFTRLPLRGSVPPQPGAPDDGRDALVLEPMVLE
jgi:4-amino-4-deoxy-L-arabinose transferase-like glycosyltransferase